MSLSEYEEFWITWWSVIQPEWQQVGSWPFTQASSSTSLWDDILLGGKDSLFIIIMSLAWWFIKWSGGSSGPMEPKNVILDISWVLSNLVPVLTA